MQASYSTNIRILYLQNNPWITYNIYNTGYVPWEHNTLLSNCTSYLSYK